MKLAILERDGIVSQPVAGELTGNHDWHALPDAASSIARLNLSGWHVVLIATQPGLGRGLYDCTALNDYHRQMYKDLAAVGAKVDAVFFCPHAPEDHCDCIATPHAALLRQILERFNTEAAKAVVVANSYPLQIAACHIGTRLHRLTAAQTADTTNDNALPATAATIHSHHSMVACVEALLQ